MAREFFKNLPDTTTPLNAQRMNGFLNGEESMGSIVVDDIKSKNFLKPMKQTITISGVTFTTNDDDSITLNGTATADISYIFSNQKIYGDGGNYYLGITTDYSNIGYNFEVAGYIYNTSDELVKVISPNRGTQVIATNEYVSSFNIYFKSGATFNNFTIYPQLEKGKLPTNYTRHIDFDGRVDIITGQECPTNEYHNGKRVYVKEIDFGNIVVDSTQILNTEISETYKIVRVLFKGYNPAKGYFTLPYFSNPDTYMSINTLETNNIAYKAVGDYFKDFKLIIEFYYTKN